MQARRFARPAAMLLAIVLALVAAGAITLLALSRRAGADLAVEYVQQKLPIEQALDTLAAAPLTEAQIAHLPALLQRYLKRAGALGKPPVRAVRVEYDGTMFQKPDGPGFPGPSEQLDVLQPPRRLFFMTSRMFGLPVAVLHDYNGSQASMQVRVASLLDVASVTGAELARIETVTFLNDLCFFAPSALAGPGFEWREIDARRLAVTYSLGGHRVQAELVFSDEGDLVNFFSDDRGLVQSDGRFKPMRWSTPMGNHREFDGRRVPTTGEAIWHPEGGSPFVYGRFTLRSYQSL
jgi:uncharacterized membrane protein